MTISSYPRIKLLVAVIAAVVIGIILDSWGWGIATFFIAMFLFIFVAGGIFGGPIKGKVEVTEELELLLDSLRDIDRYKNELPLNARGWCSSLGLYVQLRDMGTMTRLQAGDKLHFQVDAWLDYSSGLEWKVKKYNPGDWEKLVDPTLDLAYWLVGHGGLPEEYMDSFNRAIEVFKKEGHLKLPDVKKAGEEPLKLEEPESKAGDETGVKTLSNIAKATNRIEEYDKELMEDIEMLKKHISKEEDIQKEFMRSYGAPEKTIEEVVRKARIEGRPISFDGSSESIVRIQTFLTEMIPIYKEFPFRVWTREVELFRPEETNVIIEDDWLLFDTRPLNSDERKEYAKQWEATRVLNYTPNQIPVYKWYPNTELMRFIGNMLKKYGTSSVLTKDEYRDINMNAVSKETLDEGQA